MHMYNGLTYHFCSLRVPLSPAETLVFKLLVVLTPRSCFINVKQSFENRALKKQGYKEELDMHCKKYQFRRFYFIDITAP